MTSRDMHVSKCITIKIIIILINVDVNIILMLHLKSVERKTCLQGACDVVSVGLMSRLT